MSRLPPRSKPSDTPVPYTKLFRSAAAEPVQVDWDGEAAPKPEWTWWDPETSMLATQWRTTPYATDWNGDGLTDLVMLDHEGYLSFFKRFRKRSEEHTSELQSLMRISSAVFCLKTKTCKQPSH